MAVAATHCSTSCLQIVRVQIMVVTSNHINRRCDASMQRVVFVLQLATLSSSPHIAHPLPMEQHKTIAHLASLLTRKSVDCAVLYSVIHHEIHYCIQADKSAENYVLFANLSAYAFVLGVFMTLCCALLVTVEGIAHMITEHCALSKVRGSTLPGKSGLVRETDRLSTMYTHCLGLNACPPTQYSAASARAF